VSPQAVLDEIADAILDGDPVDWSVIDATDTSTDTALVDQLKTLETLRRSRRASGVPHLPGTWTWGHLQVFERIGQGAYGDVYRAWDTRLDREVALKLLPGDAPSAEPSHSTIIEEGRLLARVRHPNVVTIYGAERIDGRVGLWMELVKGRTLEEALRAGRAFKAEEVSRLGIELCHAVSAVHAAGLLHRDIKAQNVMLDDNGRLVLMDFGTGRELEELADGSDRPVAGTPLYLAPEVLAGGTATPESDVYAIGVVLFRLLTNRYPVAGGNLADLRRAHLDADDAVLRVDRAEIPTRLRAVLARVLDPHPDRRFAGADALAAALTAADRAPSRRRMIVVLAGAGALIATGTACWNFGLRERVSPALVALGVFAKTPTIAVLPFSDGGSEPGHGGFIDGLTSAVIRDLVNIDGLLAIAPESSFYFKDRPRDLRVVAEQLHADFVVEATVQRIGPRLRLDARLVRLADQVVVWSESYDRTLNDVFAIQDEISLAIVNKLRLTLGRGQRRYQANVQAYDLYLRALAVIPGRGEGRGWDVAMKLFEQVIELDRTFAPAYAGLAFVHQPMAWNLTTAGWEGMRPAAERALDLDPLLPEAHAAMGLTYAYERDWDHATRAFERALELGPNLTRVHTSYSDALVLMGQPERALELLEQAIVMDPLALPVRRDLAFAQFLNGRFDDAIAAMRKVFEADPDFMSDLIAARALMSAGRPQEAIALWKSRPVNAGWERWLARAYFMIGDQTNVDRLLAEQSQNPFHQAIVYAGMGDKDHTFEALAKAAADPTTASRTASIVFCPEMAFLRGDPRLDVLKRALKLPVER
jgi:TolB-like protein